MLLLRDDLKTKAFKWMERYSPKLFRFNFILSGDVFQIIFASFLFILR